MTMIDPSPDFEARHLGPRPAEIDDMLDAVGYDSLDTLIGDVVPESIRMEGDLGLPEAVTEAALLVRLRLGSGRESVSCNDKASSACSTCWDSSRRGNRAE